jgi:hypothetical protein
VRREHAPHHGHGREAAGGVDQRADQSGVQETGVLAEVVAPGQRDLGAAFAGGNHLDAAPAVERGTGIDRADLRERIERRVGHGRLLHWPLQSRRRSAARMSSP